MKDGLVMIYQIAIIRTLTEYGWCDFSSVVDSDDDVKMDVEHMLYNITLFLFNMILENIRNEELYPTHEKFDCYDNVQIDMDYFKVNNQYETVHIGSGVSGYNKVLPCHTISASTLSVTDYRTTRFGDDGYGKPQPHTL
ncbi:hypothetical protein U3516DRAFT_754333 [Neocallimastix sp. 'constans']